MGGSEGISYGTSAPITRPFIRYVEQEESYTSKASFLDNDSIPLWNGTHQDVSFSGKRVKRGLYRVSDHRVLNADVNGAANILRKSNHRPDFERWLEGCWLTLCE